MSLIKDMLGITPSTTRISSRLNENVTKETKSKKYPGMNREVYSLCDNGMPSQSIITQYPQVGNKSASKKPLTRWRMSPFTNPSRSDDLTLSHWSKESEINQIYPFSAFNFHIILPKYNTHYYNKEIAPLDPSWTKEETDYLWQLCELYDLRFHIIFDRYNASYDRTIEQLKHRYYSIRKKLVESQYDEKIESSKNGFSALKVISSIKEEKNRHPLIKFAYSIEKDRERKLALEKQYNITEEMRSKEAELTELIKKNEAFLKKSEKRREELKKIKRKFQLPEDQIIAINPIPTLKKPFTLLASSQIEIFRAFLPKKLLDQVDSKLFHLGANPPIIHTHKVIEKYCQLRTEVAISINLQKKVDKMKKEKEYWEIKLGNLQKLNSHSKPASSTVGTSDVTPMIHPNPMPHSFSISATHKPSTKRKSQKAHLSKNPDLELMESSVQPKPTKFKTNDPLNKQIKSENPDRPDGRKNKHKKIKTDTGPIAFQE